jgi:hypothetical protein
VDSPKALQQRQKRDVVYFEDHFSVLQENQHTILNHAFAPEQRHDHTHVGLSGDLWSRSEARNGGRSVRVGSGEVNHVHEDETDHPEVLSPNRPEVDVRTAVNVPRDYGHAAVAVPVSEANRMLVTGDQGSLLSASGDVPDPSRADGRLEVHLDDPNACLGQQDQADPVPGGHTDEGTDEKKSLAGQNPQKVYSEEGNSESRGGNECEKDEEVEIQNGRGDDDEAV